MVKFTCKDIAGTTLELTDEESVIAGGSMLTLQESRVKMGIWLDPITIKELHAALVERIKEIDLG